MRTSDDLENHMVLNLHDAPWNQPDSDETCDECHESAVTGEVVVKGIAMMLCEKCDKEHFAELERGWWEEALRAAKPGDVVVIVDGKGFRTVFFVRAVGDTCLSGDNIIADKNGTVFSAVLNCAAVSYTSFDNVVELEVVSLS